MKATDEPIETQLKVLEELSKEHPQKCLDLLSAGNSKLYAMDLLSIAVYKRSMALIAGFCEMIRSKNFTCAAPMIRMQLDNVLRFHATTLVKNPDELISGFIKGAHINNYKDHETGQRLTDSYLVKVVAKNFFGIESVYKHTSGYVHLSEKHLFEVLKHSDKAERTVEMVVGSEDYIVRDEERKEAIHAMIDITKIVLWSLDGWATHKRVSKS